MMGSEIGRKTLERFESRIIPEPNTGCWLWTGKVMTNGYAVLSCGWEGGAARTMLAHQFSYMLHNGAIPTGMQIDHKCRVRCCVNPNHLEAVTASVNVLRGLVPERMRNRFKDKTHCPRGHPYSGENLYIGSHGERMCVTCRREISRRSRARIRAERRKSCKS